MRIVSLDRVARALVLSIATLLVAACGDEPLAPSEVAGTYVLLSINGDALPAAAGYQGPADGPVTVIADTLLLAADGSGSLVRVQQPYPDPGSVERLESTLHYRTSESGLAISFDCPPNALMSCVAGPHISARLGATGLIATRLLGGQQEEFVYAEVQRLD